MPRDDRERHFENALARNLRTHVSAGNCPDTEILAAYHERSLAPEELLSRHQHIASCPRCQEILSQLEATEGIRLEADESNLVPQHTVAVPQMQIVNAARTSAAPVAQESLSKFTGPTELPRRAANWHWRAPAAALAAILLVWIAVHERTAPEFHLAKNQSTPVPPVAAPALRSAPPSLAKEEPARRDQPQPLAPKATPAEKDHASAIGDRGLFDLKTQARSAAPKRTAPRNTPQPGDALDTQQAVRTQSRILAQSPYEDKQRAGREPASQAPAPAPPPSDVAALSPGVIAESVTVESSATPVPLSPAAPEPSRAKKSESTGGIAGSTDTLTAPSTVDQPVNGRVFGALETVVVPGLAQNSVAVSSPDSSTTWRLGSSGIVEHSIDSGSHWSLQKTGIIADLLAGSAPTNKVCWIVGRTGAILLTTNAGKHWHKVASPTTEDISSVFAVNAQQATVTTITNKSYKTTNAGKIWTPLPTP